MEKVSEELNCEWDKINNELTKVFMEHQKMQEPSHKNKHKHDKNCECEHDKNCKCEEKCSCKK